MKIISYDKTTLMHRGYPEIKKLGVVSPYGEMSPFVWKGRLMRLELVDPSYGTDKVQCRGAGIRDVETGEIIAYTAQDSYFHSAYIEDDTAYILGVLPETWDTIMIYESKDLLHWESRVLLKNPGWKYCNTALTKSPEGYTLLLEAFEPKQYVGDVVYTFFFAKSKDLKTWEHLDPEECCLYKGGYNGGPWMRYSNGWYYVVSMIDMPFHHYTNYMYRTKDFQTWYVGHYNPFLMPSNEDKMLAPNAADITQELQRRIQTAFNINNSDIDLCEFEGKTYINYTCGNQLGFYWICAAEYDGTEDAFLRSFFDE